MTNRQPPDQLVGPRIWHIRAIRDIFNIAAVILLIMAASYVSGVLLPVFIAFVLAYIFDPLISFTNRQWHWPRALTVSLLMASSFLALVLFLVWLLPIVVNQFNDLRENFPKYLRLINEQFDFDFTDMQQILGKFTDTEALMKELGSRLGQTMGILQRVIGATTQTILTLALLPIYFFFFAWRFDAIKLKIDGFLPVRRKARIHHILKRMDEAIAGFFRGRIVVAGIMIVLYSVGWLMVGVPYWFLLGSMAGILNIVPYVSVVIWPVAILLKYFDSYASGEEIGFLAVFVWPSIVYFVVQLFESWFLTPWIESGKTQMSIPTVLIAVFIGGAVGGFVGLLLAIPIAACIKIFLEEIIFPRIKGWAEES